MTAAATTVIVVVSHSEDVARGVVEIAAQMAPEVEFRAAGGTDDGRIGTSFAKVMAAVSELSDEPGRGVVVLTDLGSATMTAEAVLETLTEGSDVVLADGPLVEGAVAGAVAAAGGASTAAVRQAVEEAALMFAAAQRDCSTTVDAAAESEVLERELRLHNELGLHARAAAMLSRIVAGFDAHVEVNGVDGASVLALMSLGLPMGASLMLRARGPQAEHVLDAVSQVVDDRFGEE